MANASQLFKDDEGERLGNGYVPDDDSLRNITGINKGEESGYDSSARGGAAEDIASREKSAANDTGNQSGDVKSTGAAGLASAEALSGGLAALNPALGAMKGGKILSALWGNKKRQRNTIGGSIIGLIVGGGFFGMSILSGPFEFIHIAQLLTHSHFSHQNNAGDDRVGKMWRYMRSGSIGESRLSYIESKFIKDPTIAKLKELGLELNIDSKTGINKGITIDTASDKSPYHGKTLAEVNESIKSEFNVKGSAVQIADGKFYVKDTTLNGGLASKLVTKANYSKIGTVTRGRVLGKFTFASWHPLKILDKKLNAKVANVYDDWAKSREQRLKTGVASASVDASKAGLKETDSSGKTTTKDISSTNVPTTSDGIKDTLSSLRDSKGLKVTGGIAAAIGLVCIAKNVNDKVPLIRYAQVIAPLARMGMDAINVGNQVMNGRDVDMNELALLSKQFNSVDSAGNKSSWADAASIKAGVGQTGGTDISSTTKDVISKSSIAALDWTNTPLISATCSTASQTVIGIFSFTVGVFTGETVSAIVGAAVSALAAPKLIDSLSGLLAGEAVNVLAGGAEWGNNINYGARLAANSTALQFGGVALNDKQVAELNVQSNTKDRSSFESQNFVARMFNLNDYRSLASKTLDNMLGVKQNVASIFRGGFMKLGQSILSLPSHFFASVAHAASQPYQYPFPEYGFSQGDLNNPVVQDPYANAEAVAKYLDTNVAEVAQLKKDNKPVDPNNDYVAKALACFAVNISKAEQGWDVIPADQGPGNVNNFNPYDATSYSKLNCADSSNQKWLQIRFFIFDTGVAEGLGCYFGDDQSCANDGFNSSL